MSANWFFDHLPPSPSAIENELRLSFWKTGYDEMWFSCTKGEPPYECIGLWQGKKFTVEWDTGNYLMLKMAAPDKDLLTAFERALRHRALVAYKDGNGGVVVEWRAKGGTARVQELENAGAKDLERLYSDRSNSR